MTGKNIYVTNTKDVGCFAIKLKVFLTKTPSSVKKLHGTFIWLSRIRLPGEGKKPHTVLLHNKNAYYVLAYIHGMHD